MTAVDGTIVLVNREVERLFGYSREELLGQKVELIVPEAHRGAHRAHRDAFAAQPQSRVMGAGRDLHGRHKDGSPVPVEIGLTPVTTADGLFVIASVVDISARKQAEAERAQLEEQLRHAQRLEAMGALAGGIAHDFNNVLGVIYGYAELLRGRVGDDESRADLDDLLRAASRGKELVERILQVSRRGTARRARLDLGAPVAETAALLRSTLPPSVELAVDLATDVPPVVADATAVHQVLLNLATNSAHAIAGSGSGSGSGGAGASRGRIDLALYATYVRDSFVRLNPELREGWYAVVEVRDDGAGMPPEVLARACDPFFSTRLEQGGSGLGLAMVRSLVREHGGAVVLESEEGGGTRVRCFFPSAQADPRPEAAPAPVAEAVRGAGQRVAFVDDETALAEVGARRLQRLGYRVTPFSDPHAALAAITADPAAFDLVISDFSMPRLNGLELAVAIRERCPELPIVIVTGWLEGLDEHRLGQIGVARVLHKPVTTEELAAAAAVVFGAGPPERS